MTHLYRVKQGTEVRFPRSEIVFKVVNQPTREMCAILKERSTGKMRSVVPNRRVVICERV